MQYQQVHERSEAGQLAGSESTEADRLLQGRARKGEFDFTIIVPFDEIANARNCEGRLYLVKVFVELLARHVVL